MISFQLNEYNTICQLKFKNNNLTFDEISLHNIYKENNRIYANLTVKYTYNDIYGNYDFEAYDSDKNIFINSYQFKTQPLFKGIKFGYVTLNISFNEVYIYDQSKSADLKILTNVANEEIKVLDVKIDERDFSGTLTNKKEIFSDVTSTNLNQDLSNADISLINDSPETLILKDGTIILIDTKNIDRVINQNIYINGEKQIYVGNYQTSLCSYLMNDSGKKWGQKIKNNDYRESNITSNTYRWKKPISKTSQYKGVYKHDDMYYASIVPSLGEHSVIIGKFDNELDAARAYDVAVDEYWDGDGYKNNV